ncbi:MAG: PilZ domain-containing protein [Desulfobulbaceae bacterium]
MFIKPELIVYFWLFPDFLFFIFPLLFFPLFLLGKKMFTAKAQAAVEKVPVQQPRVYDNKREHPRERIGGIIAQLSDGIQCCRGSITDISQSGVCLVSPKGKLDKNAHRLGVLLTGAGESFHMLVKPRWNRDQGEVFCIGASIEETLGNWDSLTENNEYRRFANVA